MIEARLAHQRGRSCTEWLESYHTFSFGNYDEVSHRGWGALRVINEDRVKPGKGFATHPHHHMEIISYVLTGTLEHQDSLGHTTLIQAGEVQCMSAGQGILHSEFNPSTTEIVHFLQIWIEPSRRDREAHYDQKTFSFKEKHERWCLIASEEGRKGGLSIRQNAFMYGTLIDKGKTMFYELVPGRRAYLHVVQGEVKLNGLHLSNQDGAKIAQETVLTLSAVEQKTEVLLFDLP